MEGNILSENKRILEYFQTSIIKINNGSKYYSCKKTLSIVIIIVKN